MNIGRLALFEPIVNLFKPFVSLKIDYNSYFRTKQDSGNDFSFPFPFLKVVLSLLKHYLVITYLFPLFGDHLALRPDWLDHLHIRHNKSWYSDYPSICLSSIRISNVCFSNPISKQLQELMIRKTSNKACNIFK